MVPAYRTGPELNTRRHPRADEICKAYRDGEQVKDIKYQFSVTYDRLYQVLGMAGIKARKANLKHAAHGRLELPDGLIEIIPDIRFIPRYAQKEIVSQFEGGAQPSELNAAFGRYLAPK